MRLISYRTFRSAPIFFLFGCSLVNSFWNGLDVFRLWISAGFVVLEFGVWSLEFDDDDTRDGGIWGQTFFFL